jgi:Kef-type K+ transport system membrane component KefB
MATHFLLCVGVILVAAAIFGRLAMLLSLPAVVGEMAVGPLLGATVLGRVSPRIEHALIHPEIQPALELCALLVVLLYVAEFAAETDVGYVLERRRATAGAAAAGAALAGAGAGLVYLLLSQYVPGDVSGASFFLVATGALLITAVPVLGRILDELRLADTRPGGLAMSLAVVDDFVAFGIVAIGVAVSGKQSFWFAVGGSAFLAALVLVPRFVPPEWRRRVVGPSMAAPLGLVALAAAAANGLGGSTIIAAFLLGAFVWRRSARQERERTADPYSVLRALVSLYVVWTGLSVDFADLARARLATGVLVVFVLAVATKVLASAFAARTLGLDREEFRALAILRNTRGLTELIVLNIGRDAGIFSSELYAIFFAMALLTTATSGFVIKLLATRSPLLVRAAHRSVTGAPATVASRR